MEYISLRFLINERITIIKLHIIITDTT